MAFISVYEIGNKSVSIYLVWHIVDRYVGILVNIVIKKFRYLYLYIEIDDYICCL